MGILLAFAPFIVFAVVDTLAGSTAGLVAGALVSVAMLVRNWVMSGQNVKILEAGTALLFGGLSIYTVVQGPIGSIIAVRLCVDVGLLLIILASMALGRPFTLQYARERVAREFWGTPTFVRTNYVITAIWALAFAVMVIAEAALLYIPATPRGTAIVVIILALAGAVRFTGWYPGHVRAKDSR